MRVRMARDWEAAFDGNNFQKLRAGESYDIPESFAKRYLEKGIATQDKAVDKVPETKVRTARKTTRRKSKK